MTHCTISDNEEAEVQVVISNTFRTNLEIKESILWGGPFEDGIAIGGNPTIVASYSNISLFTGTWEGVGNINEDPLFLLPEEDDYHLQCGSPCIDVGDPAGELDPDQSRADIGANPYIGSDQGVIITSNSPLCTGDTLILSAEGGLSYEWNGPNLFTSTDREIIIPTHDQNTGGTYTVVVTTAEGCQLQSITEVILEEGPSCIVTGELNLCKGESTTLIASGADSYQWSTEEEEASITVSPMETTNYILAGASNSGCSSSLNLTVVVNPLPDINIIGDTLVCVGENLELVAEGGDNYQWNTGEEGNTISINPSESSEYFVIGVNSVGCESTATHFITTNPLPLVSISGDLKICEGQSSMLSAKGGISYRWSTGETVADIEVMPTVSSTYHVTITSDFGCENQGSALVNVNPLPIAILEERDSFCIQEEAFLLTKGFLEGGFYSGSGVMNNSFDPSLAGLGLHQIVYTYEDEEGCTASDNLAITVNSCEMTGSENFNEKIAVQVYPNPTEGVFNIEMGSSLIGGELKIMDLSGQVLMHKMQVPIRLSIDHLPKGMYIIQVQQEKVRTVKNLVVQ